ncbi:MAG: Npt1/Npt2 family nucleotide transporter [Pseudomonadota bacterium]
MLSLIASDILKFFCHLLNVRRVEFISVLQTAAVMFFILSCNTTVRIMKDSILISEIGSEVLNSIKLFLVLPFAAFFTFLYNNYIDRYSFRIVFLIFGAVFIIYFLLFAFVLYPYSEFFHLSHDTILYLIGKYPMFKWQIYIVGKWSYSIFYTLAELYPNIFYILMFWQMTNNLYTVEQSWRLYPIICVIGNCGTIIIGYIYAYFSDIILDSFNCLSDNQNILQLYLSVILFVLLLIIGLFLMFKQSEFVISKKKKESKGLTFIGTLHYLYNSRYLWYIFIATAAFAMSINLVENIWKDKVRELVQNNIEYGKFMGRAMFFAGIGMVICNLCSSRLLMLFGWLGVASLAPILIGLTGLVFFGSMLVSSSYELVLVVYIGFIQNIISKSIKYSTADTAREMLYIPVDQVSATKGKAAIDLMSSKIGKSFSSIFYTTVFFLFPTIQYNDIAIYVGVIFIIIVLYWLWSVVQSSIMYSDLLTENDKVDLLDINVDSLKNDVNNIFSTFDLAAYLNKINYNNQNLVFARGIPGEIMVIGEAPGHYEDINKKPFMGRSGGFLKDILVAHNISVKKNLYITNVFLWRPENNRRPNSSELKVVSPVIKRHISLVKPKVIITLGDIPMRSVIGLKHMKITKENGNIYGYVDGGREVYVIPIVHPAYVLRQPSKKDMFLNAIKKVVGVYNSMKNNKN